MSSPSNERPRGRRTRRLALTIFAAALLAAGSSVAMLASNAEPASAAPLSIDQCNDINNAGGLTVQCDVTVVNTLTNDPLTSGSVVTVNNNGAITTTSSPDIVTSVTQCNTSARGGGGTLNCNVNIINNVTMNGPGAATAASVNQCNNNQAGDGLGNAPNTCNPVANTGGATIFQCNNRTGDGGGLVTVVPLYSHCEASGTVSSSLPMTVNQCNEDSADGGDGRVRCTVSITTNVVDTALGAPGGGGPPAGPGGPTGGPDVPTGVPPFGGPQAPVPPPILAPPRTAG